MIAGASRAGGSAREGGAGGGGARALGARPRDRHTDPCIRRKLTDAERRYLDRLFNHLDYCERMLQRAAARHHESI